MAMKKGATIVGLLLVLGGAMLALAFASHSSGKHIAQKKGIASPLVMAHRGLAYLAPELTVASFALARDVGADYIETDIQRTRDGVLINFHDEDLSRTTNVADIFPSRVKEPVGSFTYEELMRLDAGSWFNEENPDRAQPGYVGLKIPTFEAYVDTAAAGVNRPGLLIEVKDPEFYPGIEKQILQILQKKGWLDASNRTIEAPQIATSPGSVRTGLGRHRIILQSFDEKSVAILEKLAPSIIRNFLIDEDSEAEHEGFDNLLKIAVDLDAEIGAVGYLAWPWNIRRTHHAGKLFYVWTLDKMWHFRLASLFGVDGVITNRCDLYLRYLGRPLSKEPADLLTQYR